MDILDCYRLLNLQSGVSLAEIKTAYRRLARQYHPDVNPQDKYARDKFMAVHTAYKFLMSVYSHVPNNQQQENTKSQTSSPTKNNDVNSQSETKEKTRVKVEVKESVFKSNPLLSEIEAEIKRHSYQNLQQLLKENRFARAIALVEGLAQRIPNDPEIRQWQAITYQRWARQLISDRQLDKAKIYLKKALRTDPYNRALWIEVEREVRRIEQIV